MYVRTKLRPAFTLIEMVVVIGIIVLLATLSAATVMRVQKSQRESNTNNALRAVAIGLDQQWKQAVAKIGAEEPHEIILQMTSKGPAAGCGQDKARAKALHMHLRLRQEFPQTFAEARFVFPAMQWQSPCNGQVYNLASLNAMYGPKPVYIAAIGTNGNGTEPQEAGALLPIVLAQNRGGAAFNALEAGPTNSINFGGREYRVLIDSWGHEICLRRRAVDAEMSFNNNMIANELNTEPFVSKQAMTSGFKDPADPEGKLTPNVWTGANALPGVRVLAASWFRGPLNNAIADPFDGFNRGPYVMSGGQDETYTTPDDLLSFRIAGIGRGN